MKTLFLIPAALTLTVGLNVAHADGGAGPTLFTGWEIEFAQKANPPTPAPMMPTGAPMSLYGAMQNQGTWVFPPNGNEGANN